MRRNNNKRGIVVVAICLCLMMMVAGLGLGVDLNRLMATQNALRSDAEAVALAAVLELDGTPNGLERARVRAAETWRRHAVAGSGSTFTMEFGTSPTGPWLADPLASENLNAARIAAHSTFSLSLLRSVVSEKTLPVDAVTRAAQTAVERVESGLLPFAVGSGGEMIEGLTTAAQPSAERLTILNGLPFPVKTGDILVMHPSEPMVERETWQELIRSDTDPVSATYAEYSRNGLGNGRRLVLLPVVDDTRRVTDFAAYLLIPGETKTLERVGGYLAGSRWRAQANVGAWRTEVVR